MHTCVVLGRLKPNDLSAARDFRESMQGDGPGATADSNVGTKHSNAKLGISELRRRAGNTLDMTIFLCDEDNKRITWIIVELMEQWDASFAWAQKQLRNQVASLKMAVSCANGSALLPMDGLIMKCGNLWSLTRIGFSVDRHAFRGRTLFQTEMDMDEEQHLSELVGSIIMNLAKYRTRSTSLWQAWPYRFAWLAHTTNPQAHDDILY